MGLTDLFVFLRARFLGDEPFDRSWPVKVCELNDLRVDVFKFHMNDGQERRQMLCTLHIIPTSLLQVTFLTLSSVMYLLL